jgi:ketosteroid isomerase-like protein
MKKLAMTLLMACAGVGVALAQAPASTAAAAPKATSVSETLRQLERDWVEAGKAGDADKLGQILADDWKSIQYDGKIYTKQGFLDDVKAGKNKLEAFEFGPMDVKVLGNVAVVQGSDTEKSTLEGKDTTGKYVWMDVFAKRDGKWVAVRSQNAKVK